MSSIASILITLLLPAEHLLLQAVLEPYSQSISSVITCRILLRLRRYAATGGVSAFPGGPNGNWIGKHKQPDHGLTVSAMHFQHMNAAARPIDSDDTAVELQTFSGTRLGSDTETGLGTATLTRDEGLRYSRVENSWWADATAPLRESGSGPRRS